MKTYRACSLSLSLIAAALLTACATAPTAPVATPTTATPTGPFFAGFHNFHHPISTQSELAQRWFDQGLQLCYGFNHDEAIRSFRRAAEQDPAAPMPWWGIAYANGININNPTMTPERSQAAREAADQALARIDATTPAEKTLIHAVDARYALPEPEDRRPLDEAYADAMAGAYQAHPDDPDIATLYAESMMNLQPWDYWDNQGNPKGRINEIVTVLEDTMADHPLHPGAGHFYIHAVEASSNPDRATAAADRLADTVPGAGHLVHMPSHIYVRTGRYSDAVTINEKAVAADRAYFRRAPEPMLYGVYFAHNLHFLAYAGMMSGRYHDAITAARDLNREMPQDALRAFAPLIEGVMPSTQHVLIRFGKWDQVLKEPQYPEYRKVSRAIYHYARSIAFSALGHTQQAREELTAFETAAADIPEDWYIFNNKVDTVLPIAHAMINAELLYREGHREEAYALLHKGIEAEDALVYDEPPGWMLPVRHALGALLIADARYAEAEEAYREDLERHPENGWALIGLKQSLAAQGKKDEIKELDRRINRAWADADVTPTSSCYCEPTPAVP